MMKNSFAIPSILFSLLASSGVVVANPQGFQPVLGEAVCVHPDSHTLEIRTGTQTIIHWESFSIDGHETTRFMMPHADSRVLNRIHGGSLSEILGRLESNGEVYLMNPKGVLIAEGASVDTAGFIASSFDILDKDFCQGRMKFILGDGCPVINRGVITALGGDIRMIGSDVVHEGSIDALKREEKGGRIFLTARKGDLAIKGALTTLTNSIQLDGAEIVIDSSSMHADSIQVYAEGNLTLEGLTKIHTEGATITTLCADRGFQIFGGVYLNTRADLLLCANDDFVMHADVGPVVIQTREGSLSISSNETVSLLAGEEQNVDVRLIAGGAFRLVAGGPLELSSPGGQAQIFVERDFFIEADVISLEGSIQNGEGPFEILTCDLFLKPYASIELVNGDNPFRITVDDCGHLFLDEHARLSSRSRGPMALAVNGGVQLEDYAVIEAYGDLDMIAEEDIVLSHAGLRTDKGNIDLFVKGSVHLEDSSIIAAVPKKGFLHIFAGENIHVDAHSQLTIEGEDSKMLLVADYNYPKTIGPGSVLCEDGAEVSLLGTGSMRIYSSKPSIEYALPAFFTSVWGVFYPAVPKDLGSSESSCNVFYKCPNYIPK